MKQFIILACIFFLCSCTNEEALVNDIVGEYSGVYNDGSTITTAYEVIVSGDINELSFDAVQDPEFTSFSSVPDVNSNSAIQCLIEINGEDAGSANFILEDDGIFLSLLMLEPASGDTIMYSGTKQ